MSNLELHKHLQELHTELLAVKEELDNVEEMDRETLAGLEQIVSDANSLVHESAEEPASESKNSTLVDQANEFESNHPVISDLLHRITQALADMGI